MRTGILKDLSLVTGALSPRYRDYFIGHLSDKAADTARARLVNIYSAFCYLTQKTNYAGLDILNNEAAFNLHFEQVIGFISSCSNTESNVYVRSIRSGFRSIALEHGISFNDIPIPREGMSVDIQRCVKIFNNLMIKESRLQYLNGWQVKSKDALEIEINLDKLLIRFGSEFTQKVHKAISNYTYTQKYRTARASVNNSKKLFNAMAVVCPEGDDIEAHLSSQCAHLFLLKVMNYLHAETLLNGDQPKAFFRRWSEIVKLYTSCFIHTRIFDEPLKPFVIPSWKTPKDASPTFSSGGKATEKEKELWFAEIPLHIKDADAVAIIGSRIDEAITHIQNVCHSKFEELKTRDKRNAEFIQSGNIKPLGTTGVRGGRRTFVGKDHLANTVATFYEHGIAVKKDYANFLGFTGKSKNLAQELNLPTTSTLAALCTLLVIEHPEITPMWLTNWELCDRNGNNVGFYQTLNQWVAVSYKDRKGAENAEQVIPLNDLSREVVELLIRHTEIARRHLKNQGDPNCCKMLLTASLTGVTCISSPTGYDKAPSYKQWLSDDSSTVTPERAKQIASLTSLRSVRRHRALQVFLETSSANAAAQALGHKKYNPKLMDSYLPESLMDYFHERWIRQFQSAILAESLKGSKYLFDAIEMSGDELEEFLLNHGLQGVYDAFDSGYERKDFVNHDAKPEIENVTSVFDEAMFTISTALLQVLIGIKSVVETNKEVSFPERVTHWYQAASFIIGALSTNFYDDVEFKEMFEDAKNNPLDTEIIMGALVC